MRIVTTLPVLIGALLAGTLFPQTAAAQLNDPRLVFSTFHGGDRNDDANAVVVDRAGNIYVTGETESRDLKADPVGGKPLTAAVFKGYLTKYAPGGKEILWRTLIGGSSNTVPHAAALDADGNVYVAGTSGAGDLPMVHAVQSRQTGLNIVFLMKFSPEGKLLFSTLFGGSRNEEARAVAVDSQGAIYVAGRATSPDLPVKNALQPGITGGGQEGFIVKYTAEYQLAYATYFGGSGHTDDIRTIAVGPDDSLYVVGDSISPGLATPDAYIAKPGSYSSFLAKLTPAGDAVTYFTYIGWRGGYTTATALAVDGAGRAHVGGYTSSKELGVTATAYQKEFGGGGRDGFLLRMNATGTDAEYLTYLGGSTKGGTDPDETVNGLAIDSHGHVYLTGETYSPDFPGRRFVQPAHAGLQDAYLMRFDIDNNQILYTTFWGGGKKETGRALALGPGENAVLVGESYSENLPVLHAVQPKLGSTNDGFVAQICDPWLGAQWPDAFNYVRGSEAPGAREIAVWSGCAQPFEATEVAASEPWVKLTPDGKTVAMRLKIEVDPAGLEPGEYKAIIRVTVPDAFYRTLEIPVVLVVADPPPAE